MRAIPAAQRAALRDLLIPERPCSGPAWHTIVTGCGKTWGDRWPDPRCAIAFAGGNLALAGEPSALSPTFLAGLIGELLGEWDRVFIDPGSAFAETVHAALGQPSRWPRVIYTAETRLAGSAPAPRGEVRRIRAGDAGAVESLDEDIAWISDTLGGPRALAEFETAFGGFVDGELVSVSTPFYVGERFEEIGVVTARAHRGEGFSSACSAALIADIQGRGRAPCWATTPDNIASRRVAEKLGFRQTREEMHYIAGSPIDGVLPPE